jgi:hypothetical protein
VVRKKRQAEKNCIAFHPPVLKREPKKQIGVLKKLYSGNLLPIEYQILGPILTFPFLMTFDTHKDIKITTL